MQTLQRGIEGLNTSQQRVRCCTRLNDELVLEMQCTYDEEKSNMDKMTRKVALLTGMMKVIQEDRGKSEVNENVGKEEGVSETKEKRTIRCGGKVKSTAGETGRIEAGEAESVEKETLAEEKSITTSPDDETLQKSLDEENNEPQEEEDGAIKHSVEVDNTLFYLQSEKVHVPNEKVEGSTTIVDGENALAERLPPVIGKSNGCCYEEEEPGLEEERSRRKAARSIYWAQLQPWPKPLRTE